MTDVNNLRRKLAIWQQRLLRIYGEQHPYIQRWPGLP
jgi:hypothetical protein